MKKIILMFIVALAAVTGAKADGYAISGEGSAVKGGAGVIAINLENAAAVRGVQFTLTLPTTLTYSNIAKTSRTTAFNVSYSSDTKIVTITTTDENATIAAGSGAIAYINVTASDEATTQTSEVTISGCVVSFSGNSQEEPADASFNVTITDGYILDENSTVLPAATTGPVDVTVNRTLKAGVWNTICLPFELTKEMANSAFGNDATLCYLSTVVKNESTIELNFTADNLESSFPANYPFIVKPATNKSELNFNGVNVLPNENEANTLGTLSRTEGRIQVEYAKFIGTLRAGTTIPANDIFLGTDNKFYYSEGQTTIKGFRGYFWLKDFSSNTDARQINMLVDGELTKIDDLFFISGQNTEGVYNLKGQRVDTPTEKGVYIKDGKKVIVK